VLAFGEQHLLHDAVNLGMDRDRERSLHGPETSNVDRNVLPGRDCDADRHCRPTRRRRDAGGLGAWRPIPVDAGGCKDGKSNADHDDAAAVRSRTAQVIRHGHLLWRFSGRVWSLFI